jgi:hypothetical protein
MEQDFNHWHTEQTLGTQQRHEEASEPRLSRESVVMPFREPIERVLNQGI